MLWLRFGFSVILIPERLSADVKFVIAAILADGEIGGAELGQAVACRFAFELNKLLFQILRNEFQDELLFVDHNVGFGDQFAVGGLQFGP